MFNLYPLTLRSFNNFQHMQTHISPAAWYNHKSKTFKKNKRKGK